MIGFSNTSSPPMSRESLGKCFDELKAMQKERKKGSKERITIRIDEDILKWFRNKGGNYQTRINRALMDFMRNSDVPNEKPKKVINIDDITSEMFYQKRVVFGGYSKDQQLGKKK